MIYDFDDAIHFLKSTLEKKSRDNAGYSLRAFSKKLGLSPGALSLILNKKKGLSPERAQEIAGALELRPKEAEYFVLLIQLGRATSEGLRIQYLERLRKLNPKIDDAAGMRQTLLEVEHFKLLVEWHGLAILELISSVKGNWSSKSIAKKFGITKLEADLTLERLLRLGLIQETPEGRYVRAVDTVKVTSNIPNEALRRYYEGLHIQSAKSVRSQTPAEKVIGSQVFALDLSQLEEVRELTDRYLDQINALAMRAQNKTEIYQAVANVFRLSEKETSL